MSNYTRAANCGDYNKINLDELLRFHYKSNKVLELSMRYENGDVIVQEIKRPELKVLKGEP